jgi:putative ABC transport system permease protein
VERAREPLYAVAADRAGQPPVPLAGRDPRFGGDDAVWEAVRRDPTLVVSTLGPPGQQVTLAGRDGPVRLTVAGNPSAGVLPEGGAFLAAAALAAFADAPHGSVTLLRLRDPAQATAVAAELQAAGADAVTARQLADAQYRADQSLPDVIAVLMRIGLLVGIFGLGIVAVRSATERRSVIGTLRAIGYRRRDVLFSLLAESLVVTTVGTVVGIVAGIAMGYLFADRIAPASDFGVDARGLGIVIAVIYLAVLAVTFVPAVRASRLPPAEAARHNE